MAGARCVLPAWQALTQGSDPPAPPPAGSVVLVTGASGGVGVASVLLGKSMHLTMIALSRSVEKGTKLKGLGADFVFQPEAPHLRQAVLSAIAPKKVDLVVDNVGGQLFNEVIAMLSHGGRVSVVGRSGGVVPVQTPHFLPEKSHGGLCWGLTPEGQHKTRGLNRQSSRSTRKAVVWTDFSIRNVPAAFADWGKDRWGR